MDTINSEYRVRLLQTGVTIWRPVFNGEPATIYPEQSRTGGYGVVRTILPSDRNGICEPSLNAGRYRRGIVTFLVEDSKQPKPLPELPADWIGLEIVRGSTPKDASVFARPIVGDIDEYLDFRERIRLVCPDECAMNIRYAGLHLPRVFCRFVDGQNTQIEYEFFQ
jgi:hypothetical protein